MIKRLLLVTLLMLITVVAQAKFTATVNTKTVAMGNSFTLTLTIDKQHAFANPDLKPLQLNFEILGQSVQQSTQIVNGSVTANKQWFITLTPKREGSLVIPALTFDGESTQPIAITAYPYGSKHQPSGTQSDLYITASVDKPSPLLGEQVIYAVKVFIKRDASVDNLILNDPEIHGASHTKLDKDLRYQVTKDGISYQVIERRYAIFPEKTGAIIIEGGKLNGAKIVSRTQDPSGGSLFNDPFFGSSIFQSSEPFRLPVETVQMEVKPAIANIKPWLPAQSMALRDSWAVDAKQGKVQVGDPITRTIILTASGLTAAQLPQIAQPIDNVSEYPNTPQLNTVPSVNGVTSTRTETLAYIPKAAGTLTFPAITLQWWDTKLQRLQTTRLPGKTIEVVQAATPGASNLFPVPSIAKPLIKQLDPTTNSVLPSSRIFDLLLQYGGWLVAAILGIILWQRNNSKLSRHANSNARHKTTSVSDLEESQINLKQHHATKREIKAACMACDPHLTAQQIISCNSYPFSKTVAVRSLADVANQVKLNIGVGSGSEGSTGSSISNSAGSESARQILLAINELERCLYDKEPPAWDGKQFWERFCGVFALPDRQAEIKVKVQPWDSLHPVIASAEKQSMRE